MIRDLLRYVKRNIKSRLLGNKVNQAFDGEAPAEVYDDMYATSQEASLHYTNSRYYFIWTVILDRILKTSLDARVFEIGCGHGYQKRDFRLVWVFPFCRHNVHHYADDDLQARF